MPEFLDLSSNNGEVDFHKVKASGVAGVWIKATEGTSYVNPLFHRQRDEARKAGLRVGAYHFCRPDRGSTGIEEAHHFKDVVGSLSRRDLRPVQDLEVQSSLDPQELAAWAHSFSQGVTRGLGKAPLFYSYPAYIQEMRLTRTIGNGLWLADYASKPSIPKPWRKYQAWQYTSNGVCPGVNGHVDRSHARWIGAVLAYPVRGLL